MDGEPWQVDLYEVLHISSSLSYCSVVTSYNLLCHGTAYTIHKDIPPAQM